MEGYSYFNWAWVCNRCGCSVPSDFLIIDSFDGIYKLATSAHSDWHKRQVA